MSKVKKKNLPGKRRIARMLVLVALYQVEISEEPIDYIVDNIYNNKNFYRKELFQDFAEEQGFNLEKVLDEGGNSESDFWEFFKRLSRGTISKIEEVDELIKVYSKNWDFDRIALMDKIILRFSIYSFIYLPEIPFNVVIDEAVEISKAYSTEKSGKFINGILDKIYKEKVSKR